MFLNKNSPNANRAAVSLIIASKLLINFRMKIQDEDLRLHDFSRRVYFAF